MKIFRVCITVIAVFAVAAVLLTGCGGGSSSSPAVTTDTTTNTSTDNTNAVTTAPSAPTNLAATAGNGTIALAWTAVSGATSYNVYRGTASGALDTKTQIKTGLTGAAYSDATATNGTTYYYEVTAVNANGESSGSDEMSAMAAATASTTTSTLTLAQVTASCTGCHGLTVNTTVLASGSYTLSGKTSAYWLTCVDSMTSYGATLATGTTAQDYADFLAALP